MEADRQFQLFSIFSLPSTSHPFAAKQMQQGRA
jgi:hypothetical protein